MSNTEIPIQTGAIVSCYFPLTETPDCPGPVARPCLIVRIFHDKADGCWKCIVAYGTSRRSRANIGYEVRVHHASSMDYSGLDRPTRFTLSRMRVLPLTPDYFNYRNGTPMIGMLEDKSIRHMENTLESLARIAEPLRGLTTFPRVTVSQPQDPVRDDLPNAAKIIGFPLDRFMQENLCGRVGAKPGATLRQTS